MLFCWTDSVADTKTVLSDYKSCKYLACTGITMVLCKKVCSDSQTVGKGPWAVSIYCSFMYYFAT